ncbi:SMC-Scp complex subunit ScpB [Raoultibacter timonensis]|uniref:SMC-Scp complex subunit ScpB n=1 Tax=Raoultibacter timonensis TaxID=1907662 RepID=UPI000C8544CA|nr:SMC-Scp complex subunit ScpB [Raoultibacter timonensis]
MFSGLQDYQLKGALEAMLFVTDEPVSTITLADMLEVEPGEVECALVDLRAQLEDENRGIQLREVAGGWRLFTHPVYHELIERYVLSWDTRKLSQAAMETLAIVAYGQPITRGGVASVRGVNSDSSINSLVEKGLVREAGTEDAPGNPTLYATTRTFLEKFGLRSTADLPDIAEYAPDDETRAFIRERLSATRSDAPVDGEDGYGDFEARFDIDEMAERAGAGGAGNAEPAGGPLPASDGAGSPERTGGEAGEKEQAGRSDGKGDAALHPEPTGGQAMLAEAMAAGFGLVEKIDFDELTFEEE